MWNICLNLQDIILNEKLHLQSQKLDTESDKHCLIQDNSMWVVNIKGVFMLWGLLTHSAISSHCVEQGKMQSRELLLYLWHSWARALWETQEWLIYFISEENTNIKITLVVPKRSVI